MNHIKNIEIKNFKSIRNQRIDDCRRINVFIGYPNVGKSNILEALSLFSIDDSNLNFSSFIRIEDYTTLFFDGEISQRSEIKINDKHRIIGKFTNESIAFEKQFEREGTFFERNDSGNIILDNSADVSIGSSFKLGEKGKLFDFKFGSIGRQKELSQVKKYEFVKNLNHSTNGYSSLNFPFGENIFNIISTHKTLKTEVSELFEPYKLELIYDRRLQEFTILKRTGFESFSIPYSLIADTLQRLIFYKSAILSNKEKVLLLEEPEAHMFPPYISKLTSDIVNDENENQFFLASHSPFVLNDLISSVEKNELSVYIVSYENETGETLVHRMTEKDVNEAYQFGYDFFMNIDNFIPQKQHE